MTRTDHRGAIFSASPPEPFADLLRSLDLQIQKRGSGLGRGREFLLGLFPSPVAVINDPAGGHERSVRG